MIQVNLSTTTLNGKVVKEAILEKAFTTLVFTDDTRLVISSDGWLASRKYFTPAKYIVRVNDQWDPANWDEDTIIKYYFERRAQGDKVFIYEKGSERRMVVADDLNGNPRLVMLNASLTAKE